MSHLSHNRVCVTIKSQQGLCLRSSLNSCASMESSVTTGKYLCRPTSPLYNNWSQVSRLVRVLNLKSKFQAGASTCNTLLCVEQVVQSQGQRKWQWQSKRAPSQHTNSHNGSSARFPVCIHTRHSHQRHSHTHTAVQARMGLCMTGECSQPFNTPCMSSSCMSSSLSSPASSCMSSPVHHLCITCIIMHVIKLVTCMSSSLSWIRSVTSCRSKDLEELLP